jgi:F0F1-type ATP synthase assembly protein I
MEKRIKQKSSVSFYLITGMSTAILLVSPVIVLLFLGMFFDQLFHTGNMLLIGGVSIGFLGGMVNVYRLMKMMQK